MTRRRTPNSSRPDSAVTSHLSPRLRMPISSLSIGAPGDGRQQSGQQGNLRRGHTDTKVLEIKWCPQRNSNDGRASLQAWANTHRGPPTGVGVHRATGGMLAECWRLGDSESGSDENLPPHRHADVAARIDREIVQARVTDPSWFGDSAMAPGTVRALLVCSRAIGDSLFGDTTPAVSGMRLVMGLEGSLRSREAGTHGPAALAAARSSRARRGQAARTSASGIRPSVARAIISTPSD